MAHVRKQIRDRLVALLTGLPTTGQNVFPGRTRPLGADHPPTLLVYAIEEPADLQSGGEPPTQGRALTVAIEGRVIGPDVPDDALDAIAAEVETAIGANQLLGGLVKEVTLTATRITTQAPGQSQAGEARLEYRVTYFTNEGAPETAV